MSDRLAVFNAGRIQQIGTPRVVYEQPATAFVASFVGAANILSAEQAEALTGQRQSCALRPERIRLNGAAPAELQAEGTVLDVQYHGASTRLRVALDAGPELLVDCPSEREPAAPGARVSLGWPRSALQPLSPETPG